MSWAKAGAGYWELQDMSGGVNTSKLTSKVRDNQSTSSLNWYYWNGKLRNLFGTTQLSATAVNGANVPVTGVAQYKLSTGTTYLVATAGNKITYWNTGTSTWSDITGGLTITAAKRHTFGVFNDVLIGANGTDAEWQWTGTGNATALAGSPPIAKFVMPYHGYLLLGHATTGGTTYPVRVYRSDFGDATTWGAGNYWSFDNERQSPLTGMKMLGHRAVMYHEDTISFLSGKSTSTFTITADAIPGIGCVAPHSIVGGIMPRAMYSQEGQPSGAYVYEYGHLFRSREGYQFFDGGNVRMVSETLLADNSNLNAADFENNCSVYFPDRQQIWNFASTGSNTTGDGGYIYDTVYGGFWPISGYDVTACALTKNSSQYRVYLGCSDGIVRYLDTSLYTIDGSVPSNYWHSKWFDITKPAEVKLMRDFMVFVDAVGATDMRIAIEFDLEFAKRQQAGYVDLATGGATYPGVYGRDIYTATGEAMKTARLGGKSFRQMRIKVWMNNNFGAAIERFGTYLTSIGERRVA